MTEQMIEDEVFFDMDGEEYCDDELALSIMLKDEVLFCNTGKFHGDDTVCLFVNCNDVFAWACAEGQSFTTKDIPALYKLHKLGVWGSAKWCCLKRNEKPQGPVVEIMKEAGIWDDAMEALPENYYDAKCREMRIEREAKEKQDEPK